MYFSFAHCFQRSIEKRNSYEILTFSPIYFDFKEWKCKKMRNSKWFIVSEMRSFWLRVVFACRNVFLLFFLSHIPTFCLKKYILKMCFFYYFHFAKQISMCIISSFFYNGGLCMKSSNRLLIKWGIFSGLLSRPFFG